MSAKAWDLPIVQRVRAYFAPVDRAEKQPTLFDPGQSGTFNLDEPPAPWIDLGWLSDFERLSGAAIVALRSGSPATTQIQARTEIDATVRFAFASWGKLQLSLASGMQQMNVLAVQQGTSAVGSGGVALPAVPLLAGSTATTLNVGTIAAAAFSAGQMIAVDVDYKIGTQGFLGSGVSGAYAQSGITDVDYVRRITLNVGRIASISNGQLLLEEPLIAGIPQGTEKVSVVTGFCDREGSRFFQEWSALFVAEGQQGDRLIWHYPRLESAAGITEALAKAGSGYTAWKLAGTYRALPVTDVVDGERIVCFRSYLPA